jgi:hypothetical protein
MLISILSIIIVLYFALYAKKNAKKDDSEDFGWGDVIYITVIFGFFVSLFLHILSYPFVIEHKYKIYEKEIVASKSDSRIDGYTGGGLFYVKGKIDEVDYYFVITKTNEIYKQEKVPVENTVIVETTGKPKVVVNKHYCGASAWPDWIRFHKDPECRSEKDTIYVPVGTVENNKKFEVF